LSNHRAPRELLLLDGRQHVRAPGHWQGWLAQQATDLGWTVDVPTLPRPDAPSLTAWRASVLAALRRSPGCTVVAHGLTALLWLQLAAGGLDGTLAPQRVLLVAPPGPGSVGGGDVGAPLPAAVTAAAVRALSVQVPQLVFAPDDPWTTPDAGATYARPLELAAVAVPGGGHLNGASGFGPWPAVLHWLLDGVWPDPATGPEQALTLHHLPSGRRLGIAVAGPVSPHLRRHAELLLERAGQRPVRRLATLRPRVGEPRTRAEDVADFVRRYGHEYTVVTVTEDLLSGPLVDACRTEGCHLVTAPANRTS